MGERASALGLAGVVLAATVAAGRAAERTPTMALGIDGSIPLAYSDDRFDNPGGRADYLTSPYLRLSLEGKLAEYRDRIMDWGPMQQWIEESRAEPMEIEELDIEF